MSSQFPQSPGFSMSATANPAIGIKPPKPTNLSKEMVKSIGNSPVSRALDPAFERVLNAKNRIFKRSEILPKTAALRELAYNAGLLKSADVSFEELIEASQFLKYAPFAAGGVGALGLGTLGAGIGALSGSKDKETGKSTRKRNAAIGGGIGALAGGFGGDHAFRTLVGDLKIRPSVAGAGMKYLGVYPANSSGRQIYNATQKFLQSLQP